MEPVSVLDIFKVGIGPSSSHTLGPWRAAARFVEDCRSLGVLDRVRSVRVELHGSLAKTGRGHGTDLAIVWGLLGEDPATCDPAGLGPQIDAVRESGTLRLRGGPSIGFTMREGIVFRPEVSQPFHPNGMWIAAELDDGPRVERTYYSIGGGFIVEEGEEPVAPGGRAVPLRFGSAGELLATCRREGLSIAEVVERNERAGRSAAEVEAGLRRIWETMRGCVHRGCQASGVLPGPLGVVRRAGTIQRKLIGAEAALGEAAWLAAIRAHSQGFRETLEWVACFALAVNEENAAFGRVVTAPTNGAAGVIPAVLLHDVCTRDPSEAQVLPFLLTAGAVGCLFKRGATISAAMGGCQAEIGVSSAMAAAGLCQVLGGSPEHVLMAAEIAMEHHLGLTCDPVGGFVQIPCIERNTMGAIKAITACHLALASDPTAAKVALDTVIRTMWETAQDMSTKYKETSEGGLAIQIPVSVSEC